MNNQNIPQQQINNSNKTSQDFSSKEKLNSKSSNSYVIFRQSITNIKSSMNNCHLFKKSFNLTKQETQTKKIISQKYISKQLTSKEKVPKNLLENINSQKSTDNINHESKLTIVEIPNLVSNQKKEITENQKNNNEFNIKYDNKINKCKLKSSDSIPKTFENNKDIENDNNNENDNLIRIINKNLKFQHDRGVNSGKRRTCIRFIGNEKTNNIPDKTLNVKKNNNNNYYYSNKNYEKKLYKSCKKNNHKICEKNNSCKKKIDVTTKITSNRKSVLIPSKSKTQNFNNKYPLGEISNLNNLNNNIEFNNIENISHENDLNKESKNLLLSKNLRRTKKIVNKRKIYNDKTTSDTYKFSTNHSQQQNSLSNKDFKTSVVFINQNLEEDRFKNFNSPIINKVLVFEIGNKSMFSSYKKGIFNKANENGYYNACFINNSEEIYFSPLKSKDHLADIIKNNIAYNLKEKNKNRINKNNKTEFCEDCKMNFYRGNNKKAKFLNMHENNNGKINPNCITPIDKKYHIKRNFILDNVKQNSKKNVTNNINKSKMKINESSETTENEEIINQSKESTYSSQKMKKSFSFCQQTIKNNINNKSNIIYITCLDNDCLKTIFNYLDLQMLNTLRLINKKFYSCFKNIVNSIIQKKIINEHMKNIPNKSKILKSLIEYSPLSKLTPTNLKKKYTDLIEVCNEKYDKEIKKDLTRTIPENNSFNYGNINYNKLYHLLTAYVNYNPKIGYAQGLNFLAAYLISLFDKEENEFIIMDGLINKFKFDKLLGVNNELNLKLEIINNFIKKYCYNVYQYLDEMNLNHEFFTTNWMITLFSYSMDNNKYLYYLWEFMIVYNWKFLKCFIVALLNIYENKIINSLPNDLTFLMKNILKSEDFFEKFNTIIDKAFYYLDNDENII